MIFLSREETAEVMSENFSLSGFGTVKDSEPGKWNKTARVGPESHKNGEIDFHAFSLSPTMEEMYLEFIPPSVAKMLNDKSNWNNRLSAVGDIEKSLKQMSTVLSDADLKHVIDLVAVSVNDSQSKVSQKGLQVMEYLAMLVGKRLVPYLGSLTMKILTRVSSNKGNLKKAGMSLFKMLMDTIGPMQILKEVVNCGLRYKTSRIREEAINVIISALLYYKNGGIQLLPLAKELISCMMDSKAKVRQASFEAMALITRRSEGSVEFEEVIEMVANAHRAVESRKSHEESGLSLMDAFQSRLARELYPRLDENGLVQYSVSVLRSSSELLGPDVDWICAGTIPGASTGHLQSASKSPLLQVAQNPPQPQHSAAPMEAAFRPYRSAGKRPWETENKAETSVLSAPPRLISPPLTSTPATNNTPPKRLPNNSYMELYLSKLAKSSSNMEHKPILHKSNLGSLMPKSERPPMDSGHPSFALLRLNSMSNEIVSMDHPQKERESVVPVIVSAPSNEKYPMPGDERGHPMSLTWPRTNLGAGLGGSSVTPFNTKGSAQINADSAGVAGVESTVKTSFSRPPSKPRVRNPLTLLRSHSQSQGQGISPPLSGSGCPPIPSIGYTHSKVATDSPTQLEKDFLGGAYVMPPSGWGEGSQEDEFFALIPEDTAILDRSLSTSLSSICSPGNRDAENGSEVAVDKLRHIRKEAASRRAQIKSTSTTTANSPESPRHSISDGRTLGESPTLKKHRKPKASPPKAPVPKEVQLSGQPSPPIVPSQVSPSKAAPSPSGQVPVPTPQSQVPLPSNVLQLKVPPSKVPPPQMPPSSQVPVPPPPSKAAQTKSPSPKVLPPWVPPSRQAPVPSREVLASQSKASQSKAPSSKVLASQAPPSRQVPVPSSRVSPPLSQIPSPQVPHVLVPPSQVPPVSDQIQVQVPPSDPPQSPSQTLAPPQDAKPTVAGPILKKWNALDVDRVYGGSKEERTYSQAFAKKMSSSSNSKPPFKVGTQIKREKEKGTLFQNLSSGHVSEEPEAAGAGFSISLEGHGLDQRGGEGGANGAAKVVAHQRKKAKRPDKSQTTIGLSLLSSQEGGNRPTIERGGTNTILMEVSGVGSRATASSEQGQTLLSQNTKESFMRKKKNYQSADDCEVVDRGSPRKPLQRSEALDESTTSSSITSAPVEMTHRRNKHRKDSKDRSKPQSHQTSRGGGGATLVVTDMDSPLSTGGASPQEQDSALLESQVHSNPDQALRTAHQSMASDDWTNKCEGMTMVMCLARHYPALLQPQLHFTLLAVQKEVKNLRSSVARKAVECLGCLFTTMRRAIEPDLDTLVQTLLHKGAESNAFLREVVDKAIMEMVVNVSPPRALSALILGGLSHRNPLVRRMTSKFVCVIVEAYEPSRFLHTSKDVLDRALPAIVQLAKDNSPDARYYARKCLNALWPEPDFLQVASRVLKNNLLAEAKDVVETLKMKGLGDPPSESQSIKGYNGTASTSSSRHPTGSLRLSSQQKDSEHSPHLEPSSNSSYTSEMPRKTRKHQGGYHGYEKFPSQQEIALPEGLADRLQASNWSERDEAITELERFVQGSQPQILSPQLQKVFDVFCLRLTDRNSKVNLHALQAFSSMVPVLRSALVPIINPIMGTLVPNLASRNLTIHSTAMTVLDLLSHNIDAVHLLPTVANSSQHGNSRIQPIMTRILASLTPSAYAQKPQLVNRLVLPVVWHHVSNRNPITGEAKATLQELCKVLLRYMGPALVDNATHLSVEQRKKLDNLLDGLDIPSR